MQRVFSMPGSRRHCGLFVLNRLVCAVRFVYHSVTSVGMLDVVFLVLREKCFDNVLV